MQDTMLPYSIGALLYCPANNESIVNALVCGNLGNQFSLSLCLEDTIRDDRVEEAEAQLVRSLNMLMKKSVETQFYMPKIFIRVREPQQIQRLYTKIGEAASLITGFTLPKFSLNNADDYIAEIKAVNNAFDKPVYMMPIFESPELIDLRNRYSILYELKDRLAQVSDLTLNIRVGGNDLCHAFGCRRHSDESIYDIQPVAGILSDIFTVFGQDYVVSGPVWEYYNSPGWDSGLFHELARDKLNGFIGKTVIHPKQIDVVNRAYKVSKADYEDAASILDWSSDIAGLVVGGTASGRMNEQKTHSNWAKKIIILSQIYGVLD